MNIKELIESISHLPSDCSGPRPMIDKLTTLELIKLLDEPQKVTIPQFVADYIESEKDSECGLLGSMKDVPYEDNAELRKWFYKGGNVEVFARAWLDGYTVEKEKRYLVKIKGITTSPNYLKYNTKSDNWFLSSRGESFPYRAKHTRKELEEAGFSEVFNSPLFEVEEQEDE